MDEIKAMLETLVRGCLKARNEADDKKDDKEDDKAKNEDKKACNEDVDKRDIIRQIMAIAGKEEASEDVKTIAKLAEKLAYDKSEAGTADNCGKKAKNADEEAYEELKEETKEEAANKKAKNEDEDKDDDKKEDDKKEEDKKAQNSLDEVKKLFFEGTYKPQSKYMTQKQGVELGKKLY